LSSSTRLALGWQGCNSSRAGDVRQNPEGDQPVVGQPAPVSSLVEVFNRHNSERANRRRGAQISFGQQVGTVVAFDAFACPAAWQA
jgi:hypothetical protein